MASGSPCCPPNSHGAAPPSTEPVCGEVKSTKRGLQYYEVGEGSNIVVVCSDVFGWESGRHKAVCDILAKDGGFHVYMPDYFHGDPAAYVPEGPFKLFSFLPELIRVVFQAPRMIYKIRTKFSAANVVQKDILEDLIPMIKDHNSEQVKLACLGFCFGGWVIAKACASGVFNCGVTCHPSFAVEFVFGGSEEQVAKDVKKSSPILLMPASNDSAKLKPGGVCMKILGEESKSIPFENMIHGWVTRGDRNDEGIKEAQDQALDHTIEFIHAQFAKL